GVTVDYRHHLRPGRWRWRGINAPGLVWQGLPRFHPPLARGRPSILLAGRRGGVPGVAVRDRTEPATGWRFRAYPLRAVHASCALLVVELARPAGVAPAVASAGGRRCGYRCPLHCRRLVLHLDSRRFDRV